MKRLFSIAFIYFFLAGNLFAEVPTRPEITGTFHENYYGRTNEDASFKNVSTSLLTTNTLGVGISNPAHQMHVLLRGADNVFFDGRTNERIITLGATRWEHTAGTNGTRAINIDVDTNNHFDTHAVNVNYVANGVVAGDYNHIYDLHIDLANSTGGKISGYVCSQTGSGLAGTECVDVYPGVSPVEQHSGNLTDSDAAFTFDGSFENATSAFKSDSNNIPILSANSDYIYFGHSVQFDDIEINLSTFADGAGIKPVFEFSAGGGTWTVFTPTDGSNGFRQNGNARWEIEPLATWTPDTVNGVANKYWVRVQRTQNNVNTTPVEKTLKIISAIIYSWNSDGKISIDTLAADIITSFTSGIPVQYQVNQALPLFSSHSSFTINGTHEVLECDATFQNVSIFFPGVSNYQGVCFSVKKMDDTNRCYLSTLGVEGFDNLSTLEITEQFQAPLICGGTTEWGMR